MPSLHAAWPFFASLYVVKVFGKKWLPIFIVPIMIAIATWYGAEHYVIDSLLGFFLAFVFYKVSWRWFFRKETPSLKYGNIAYSQ
jgi:membrane-associated phospholipid phosphatase